MSTNASTLSERIAAYFVLFTWIYDGFNQLPYLRLRSDPESGKTRVLPTVGSFCYKPIFASGASTVSPLFRILDMLRGTLIIDEGDFKLSDERAEVCETSRRRPPRDRRVLDMYLNGNNDGRNSRRRVRYRISRMVRKLRAMNGERWDVSRHRES